MSKESENTQMNIIKGHYYTWEGVRLVIKCIDVDGIRWKGVVVDSELWSFPIDSIQNGLSDSPYWKPAKEWRFKNLMQQFEKAKNSTV